jgi:hypothetical protein
MQSGLLHRAEFAGRGADDIEEDGISKKNIGGKKASKTTTTK